MPRAAPRADDFADGDSAGGRRVPQRAADAERLADLERSEDALGRALGAKPAPGIVRQPAKREEREVGGGDDVGAVPGSPELGERVDAEWADARWSSLQATGGQP